jgi:hypothetical protein
MPTRDDRMKTQYDQIADAFRLGPAPRLGRMIASLIIFKKSRGGRAVATSRLFIDDCDAKRRARRVR